MYCFHTLEEKCGISFKQFHHIQGDSLWIRVPGIRLLVVKGKNTQFQRYMYLLFCDGGILRAHPLTLVFANSEAQHVWHD